MIDHVDVGNIRYTVEASVEAINEKKALEGDQYLVGYADHAVQRIILDPKQGPDQMRDTLLHEVTHAIWRHGGLDAGAELHREQIATIMATGWLDTMRRNPDLVAYLMEEH